MCRNRVRLTLKLPITRIAVCFVICLWLDKSFLQTVWTQIRLLLRSSLIRVHTVCLYAKIGLKSLQEYSADNINRQHFQMQVFLAFSRVNTYTVAGDFYHFSRQNTYWIVGLLVPIRAAFRLKCICTTNIIRSIPLSKNLDIVLTFVLKLYRWKNNWIWNTKFKYFTLLILVWNKNSQNSYYQHSVMGLIIFFTIWHEGGGWVPLYFKDSNLFCLFLLLLNVLLSSYLLG